MDIDLVILKLGDKRMDKYQSATRFYNKYVKLSDSKKEEFSRITNKLLSVNYLCAAKERDKDDYYGNLE